MKRDRVTLRVDDALTAFIELRWSIQSLDKTLSGHCSDREQLQKFRDEKWESYQRIAKALGVKPTLDKVEERKSA